MLALVLVLHIVYVYTCIICAMMYTYMFACRWMRNTQNFYTYTHDLSDSNVSALLKQNLLRHLEPAVLLQSHSVVLGNKSHHKYEGNFGKRSSLYKWEGWLCLKPHFYSFVTLAFWDNFVWKSRNWFHVHHSYWKLFLRFFFFFLFV